MELLFWLLVAILASVGITYLCLRPRIISVQELDQQAAEENRRLEVDNQNLRVEKELLLYSKQGLEQETQQLTQERDTLTEKLNDLGNSIAIVEKQAQEAADIFYQTNMQIAVEHFEKAMEEEATKFQQSVENFETQYQETIGVLMGEYKTLEESVAALRAINDAAVAAAKRQEEMKDMQNFYRLQLAKEDIEEIEALRSIESQLRNSEPLNKVIWKCYYEKPTTDLIGRVIGGGIHTGIYKITDVASGKCYVGQAVNLAERWKQHIKRGVGAETPTRNKLYPAMRVLGPENFTFEVIEECSRADLDAQEDYWQDYFKAKEFGFSIK